MGIPSANQGSYPRIRGLEIASFVGPRVGPSKLPSHDVESGAISNPIVMASLVICCWPRLRRLSSSCRHPESISSSSQQSGGAGWKVKWEGRKGGAKGPSRRSIDRQIEKMTAVEPNRGTRCEHRTLSHSLIQ